MKTIRKLLLTPLALLLVLVMATPIVASPPINLDVVITSDVGTRMTASHVIDYAWVLDNAQRINLNNRLALISRNRNNTVAIVTVDSLNVLGTRDAIRASDQMYDRMGFGRDGIMLFLSMEEGNREWQIVTRGFSETAFTNRGLANIERQILPYLRANNFYAAFNLFVTLADDFLADARAGSVRHDSGYTVVVAVVCTVIAVAIALAIVFGLKSGHKSAKPQRAACNYVRAGSFNLTTQRDLFLFRRITKVARPQANSGGGGGGRVGGGRGGRF